MLTCYNVNGYFFPIIIWNKDFTIGRTATKNKMTNIIDTKMSPRVGVWRLGCTAKAPEVNATIIPPMESWTRLAGAARRIGKTVATKKSFRMARDEKKKEIKSNIRNAWKYVFSFKTGVPSLLNPPGGVNAAVNVTVAISTPTSKLVSSLFEAKSEWACSFSLLSAAMAGGQEVSLSGHINFLKSRLICCWKNGTPVERPRWCKTLWLSKISWNTYI